MTTSGTMIVDWELYSDVDKKIHIATIKGASVWPIPDWIPDVGG